MFLFYLFSTSFLLADESEDILDYTEAIDAILSEEATHYKWRFEIKGASDDFAAKFSRLWYPLSYIPVAMGVNVNRESFEKPLNLKINSSIGVQADVAFFQIGSGVSVDTVIKPVSKPYFDGDFYIESGMKVAAAAQIIVRQAYPLSSRNISSRIEVLFRWEV